MFVGTEADGSVKPDPYTGSAIVFVGTEADGSVKPDPYTGGVHYVGAELDPPNTQRRNSWP